MSKIFAMLREQYEITWKWKLFDPGTGRKRFSFNNMTSSAPRSNMFRLFTFPLFLFGLHLVRLPRQLENLDSELQDFLATKFLVPPKGNFECHYF